MTSDERATMRDELEEPAADSYWGIRVDELRELLQAHEELEDAFVLLREIAEAVVDEADKGIAMPSFCRICEHEDGHYEGGDDIDDKPCVVARIADLSAAHDARTAGTAAREGGGDADR